ncbi:hypothetical protein DFJ58DRAFT_758684 [Suillus subalutaceus]|uniref:uncharacterized protein n=1 Tax=Suillus subalutaceus TaxID=48586 RepID=UPI001B85EE0E|nr:uncharacterized protein DFJ58DRAFT_758684 [Suillus subalutaceus]KAG1874774.1 hypothetical protein DFJ58DRAFT_758684 [Suillus subalutaceus]
MCKLQNGRRTVISRMAGVTFLVFPCTFCTTDAVDFGYILGRGPKPFPPSNVQRNGPRGGQRPVNALGAIQKLLLHHVYDPPKKRQPDSQLGGADGGHERSRHQAPRCA